MYGQHPGQGFSSSQVTNQRNAHASSSQRHTASSQDLIAMNLGMQSGNASFYPPSNMNMSQQDVNSFSQGTAASSSSFAFHNSQPAPLSHSQPEMPSQMTGDSSAPIAGLRGSRVSDLLSHILAQFQASSQRTAEAVESGLQGLKAERDAAQLKAQEVQLEAMKELFESAVDGKLTEMHADIKKDLAAETRARKNAATAANKQVTSRLDAITKACKQEATLATERDAASSEQMAEILERLKSIETAQKEQRIRETAMEAALSKLTHAVERQTELDAATLSAIQQLARQVTARPPRRSLAIEPTSQPSEDAYSRPLERSTGLAPLSNEGGASMPQSDSTLTSGGATQQTDSQLPSQPLAGASFDSLGSDAGLASNVRRSPSKRGLERAPSVEAGRKRQRRMLLRSSENEEFEKEE